VSTFDRDTGRDRYFEARERELEALAPTQHVDCPVCGSAEHESLFAKHGFTFVRCSSCGLVFVNPQLDQEAVLEEYRTAATNDLWFDVLTSERQQELDRAKFAEVLDALEPYRGKLLDVGCSIGLFLHLAQERGWDVTGLEPAPRAREHARQVYGLEVRDQTLEGTAFPAESFDAVALLSVLEHATEPLALLRECARVLRPGGALYVIVPNVESLACNVLGAEARTFDGRNHLVYFSADRRARSRRVRGRTDEHPRRLTRACLRTRRGTRPLRRQGACAQRMAGGARRRARARCRARRPRVQAALSRDERLLT
jgi:SAM-dependent methyltransferase